MFTGIIEELGEIAELKTTADNLNIRVKAKMTPELKVDQSIAHNGVCLTVVAIDSPYYTVTAIKETLDKTNLKELSTGSIINLERGMKLGARLDGHIVQGHVDHTAVCSHIEELEGSTYFTFSYVESSENITIEKGSITVNGVSLTVVNSGKNEFSVAIIPYTLEHTTFKLLKTGDTVNLEFDVIGKYVQRLKKLGK
ncbi:riboflavin synthase subunit alpha [Salinimicrobium marinum]|uniref:Riboflavin synthase n=1 Tax=Salinimicrobium marinum TaxID=680283 RepID=A0A918SIW5_9FLAO|nr:riboflavin synthase [Salinimicrobium marinum]GHA46882.1 riboflavin synthase subunit alpha [Salinimicrobium marinum]